MARRALFFLLLRLVVCARTGRRASPHLGGELRRAEGRDRRRRRRRRRREGTTGHHGEHQRSRRKRRGKGGRKVGGEESTRSRDAPRHHGLTGQSVRNLSRRTVRKSEKVAKICRDEPPTTQLPNYQTTFRLSPRLQGCRPADYTTDYGYTSESNPIRSIHHPTRSVHTPTHGRALATRSTPHHC